MVAGRWLWLCRTRSRWIGAAALLGCLGPFSGSACSSNGSTYVPGAGAGGAGNGGRLAQGGKGGQSGGAAGQAEAGADAGGGGAGAPQGGTGGTAGASGAGPAGDGGQGGEGGEAGDGTIRTFASCSELHEAEPALSSGEYAVQPANALEPFTVYCDMETSSGGWTLALNEGTSFDPLTMGSTDAVCYLESCTSRAYSTLPIGSDLMFDLSDTAIVDAGFAVRAVVFGVPSATRGNTLRTAFTSGPFHVDAEDNSNVVVSPDDACSTMPFADMRDILCGTRTMTLTDPTGEQCGTQATFAIGGSNSHSLLWDNCSGWPQQPNPQQNYYPDYIRVWVR